MSEHLDFDALNDLATGEIADAAQRAAAERHVASCGACATQLAAVRDLLHRTRGLPRSIEPPDDLWADVRAAIRPGGAVVGAARTLAWWRRPTSWMLAAAALVLVASSSAVTASFLRRSTLADPAPTERAIGVHSASLPAALALVEAGYDDTARQLQATLALQRHRLSPRTISTVEHSLAVIDTAIAEARHALLEDPANRSLMDIYTANYEHKLELLRRATELTSSL
jgi:hypothetical protein